MHRFFVLEGSPADGLVIEGREAHHAADVLRVRQGELVATLNGRGLVRECTIQRISRGRVDLALLRETRLPRPACSITLLQAIPKGKTFDTIVQKATEIGAAKIVPLLTERVVVELEEADAERKVAKWQQAAIEAAKQCGTAWMPDILAPTPLSAWLPSRPVYDLSLVACLMPNSRNPREFIEQYRQAHAQPPASVALFIGPEGDFTNEEYQQIQGSGALPITLGPNVLRADTAAAYGLAILSYEFLAKAPA